MSFSDIRPKPPQPPLPPLPVLLQEAIGALTQNRGWIARRLAAPVLILAGLRFVAVTEAGADIAAQYGLMLLSLLLVFFTGAAVAVFGLRAFILGEWDSSPLRVVSISAYWAVVLAVLGWMLAALFCSMLLLGLLGGLLGNSPAAAGIAAGAVSMLGFGMMAQCSLWFVSLSVGHERVELAQAWEAARRAKGRLIPGMATMTFAYVVLEILLTLFLQAAGEAWLAVLVVLPVQTAAVLLWALAMASFAGRIYMELLPPHKQPPPLPGMRAP